MKIDLYDLLKVHRDAPMEVIKRAYRKAASEHHPDKGGDRDKFALVILARDTLTDAARRARYDKTGETEDFGPDQTESDAMQIAMQAIAMVMGEIEARRRPIEQFDVLGDAIKGLKRKIVEMKAAEKTARDSAAKIRKLAKRFKAKRGKPNRIAPMMEAQARGQDDAAVNAVRPLPAYERAIEILGEHSFAMEPVSPYGGQSPLAGYISQFS
jgi:curved DNA-binding protein CbpA